MQFLNFALLAGLAVAALPVIIHLLNRRKARVIDWGAMRFLEMSLASRGRRVMIEELLLLLLRTALLAVLVLAMARPLLVNPHFAGPGAAGQDVAIILDGSMSMGLVPSGAPEGAAEGADEPNPDSKGSYFDWACKAAGQAVDRLSPGDAVAVVLAGATPQRLTENLTFDREAARRAIGQARLTNGVADVTGSLALAGRILESGRNAHKQALFITDGRSHGWRIDSTEDWQALAGKLASARRAPRVQVLELARGHERPGRRSRPGAPPAAGPLLNLAIEQVSLSRPVIGTDLPVVLKAEVRNTGEVSTPPVRLLLRPAPGADPIDAQTVPDLAPMAQEAVQLQAHFTEPGPYRLVFELDFTDALATDNRLLYALEVLKTLPVLLVNGEPSPVRDQDECFWLQSAFQPVADIPEAQPIEFLVKPKVVELPLLAQEDLNRYYAVVLANVPRLETEMLGRLREYVRNGGGLLVAPGAKIDRAFYNTAMFDAGKGLLPATLEEPVDLKVDPAPSVGPHPGRGPQSQRIGIGDPAPGPAGGGTTPGRDEAGGPEPMVTLGPAPQGHPALIRSAEPTLWEVVRAFRCYPLSAAEGAEVATVLQLSTGPPFALEKRLGQGRVILLGGPLDTAWSNAPLHNVYVILVNELMYYLSSPRRTTLNLAPSEMLVAPAPLDDPNAAAEVCTPDDRQFALTRVFEGGRWQYRFGQTAEPGVYQLRFTSASAGESIVYFTVQRDAGESFLTLLDESARGQVSETLAGVAFHADPAMLLEALRVTDPGREIWKLLAGAVLLMLLLEIWLTRRITRHRHGELDSGVKFGQAPLHTVR